MDVVWFKKDLRVTDHAPLAEAARSGPLVCLWIDEEEVYAGEDFDASHLAFANECLLELDEKLQEAGGRLVRRRGEATLVLEKLWRELSFQRLHSHEETGNGITYQRDLRVARWCRERRVEWLETTQTGVVRRLRTRDGWATLWAARMTLPCTDAPDQIQSVPVVSDPICTPESVGLGADNRAAWRQRGGSREARRWLESFLTQRGRDYTRAMSSPVTAYEACSRISPYLTWGCLGVREAFAAVRQQKAIWEEAQMSGVKVDPRWFQAARSFAGRLRWHCHFMQKLEDEPALEYRNLARIYDGLREDAWDEERFSAWAEGRTGYPMVDACMRALTATGWLNFRMRAMVMSFASYHLWLHWRKTGLHLARLFLDYEPGIHWSQSQMQSGTTGINTLRVYSPAKQLLDHDPEGVFVRKWVPELQNVPAKWLAEPHTMPAMEQCFAGCIVGHDYPFPIVEHKVAYAHAQKKMFLLRKQPASRLEARSIQKKHGSRKAASREWR